MMKKFNFEGSVREFAEYMNSKKEYRFASRVPRRFFLYFCKMYWGISQFKCFCRKTPCNIVTTFT